MPYLYLVRCNFTRPDLEQSWNDWYSGEKIGQLLAKPMFRAVQRFRRAAGTGRSYLAVWQVVSPDAFKTREYAADWGFAEWLPYIVDWSRDLFDATRAPDGAFAVPPDGALQVISFDGLDGDRARAARAALASEASGQRGDSIVRAHSASEDARKRVGDIRPEPGSSARAALASEASGQRGDSIVRAPDTRPEPGSSARDALAERADVMWFDSVGLDRHTALIGLRRFADAAAAPAPVTPSPAGVQAGIYRPISELCTVPAQQAR